MKKQRMPSGTKDACDAKIYVVIDSQGRVVRHISCTIANLSTLIDAENLETWFYIKIYNFT